MKILLVNTPAKERPVVRDMAGGLGFGVGEGLILPPLDLAYMAATLVLKGHDVKILDAGGLRLGASDALAAVSDFAPDISIATVSLPTLESDCGFIRGIPAAHKCRVIARTAIAVPEILREILAKSLAEKCVFGEADLAIDDIIAGRDDRGSAELVDGALTVGSALLVEDMDKLPIPARGLLPNDIYRYQLLGDRVTAMQSSRGCPYPCAYYCPYPLVQGRKWRARSPGHILAEIEDIKFGQGIDKILFRDATFTLDKKRTLEICSGIVDRGIEIDWWCETRIDCLDEELIASMKSAGCRGINIGVETGDPVLMQSRAKAGLTIKKIRDIIGFASQSGIRLHFLLLIGLPGETRRSLFETYKLIRDFKPETIGVCLITPYPGTPLYDEARRNGWIETSDWSMYDGHKPVMHTENMSSVDLETAHTMLRRGFEIPRQRRFRALRRLVFEYKFKRWMRRDERR